MESYKIHYVVLAKSIPEYSKRDQTCYTCSIGFSPQFGLIRVYPLPISSMNKWDHFEIEIERNKYDSRSESWKLSTYSRKENWIGLSEDVTYLGKVKPDFILNRLTHYAFPSIKTLNAIKKSIGIVELHDYKIYWNTNERLINTGQLGLFEDVEIADFTKYTKESKNKEARIYFRDANGEHDIQYNEWQVYEYQRKFSATEEAFRFMHNKNYLLVGNMHNYRNTWIGLGLFQLPMNINMGMIINKTKLVGTQEQGTLF
jgi:hypothetical protein